MGWWPALAALFLFAAFACDMLDGAVARVGHLGSRSGAVLDSAVDRFSDMAIYLACALHFALLPQPNVTYQLLAVLALCNGVLISYIKARAENMIEDCTVGYWLRGERCAALLIGCTFGHMPAVLWADGGIRGLYGVAPHVVRVPGRAGGGRRLAAAATRPASRLDRRPPALAEAARLGGL